MAQVGAMQQQLLAAQSEIAATSLTGTAGNGLVSVTGTGEGEITALVIDPKVVDPEDVETLQDLIIGALQDLRDRQAELANAKMGPLAGGMPGGFPGLG